MKVDVPLKVFPVDADKMYQIPKKPIKSPPK